jgi:hypothetical protein
MIKIEIEELVRHSKKLCAFTVVGVFTNNF